MKPRAILKTEPLQVPQLSDQLARAICDRLLEQALTCDVTTAHGTLFERLYGAVVGDLLLRYEHATCSEG